MARGTAVACFITFRTHGTWLHSDDRGSMDRDHRGVGQPPLPANPALERWERGRLKRPPVMLDRAARDSVELAMRAVAAHGGWEVIALNVHDRRVQDGGRQQFARSRSRY